MINKAFSTKQKPHLNKIQAFLSEQNSNFWLLYKCLTIATEGA